MILLKPVAVWVLLAVVAIANGIGRHVLLSPHLSDRTAHQVGTLSACILIFLITLALIPWLGATSTRELLGIGLLWLAMTIAFEFLFGHYVAGHSWHKLLADYHLLRGRI